MAEEHQLNVTVKMPVSYTLRLGVWCSRCNGSIAGCEPVGAGSIPVVHPMKYFTKQSYKKYTQAKRVANFWNNPGNTAPFEAKIRINRNRKWKWTVYWYELD